jgi:hypothetical protein
MKLIKIRNKKGKTLYINEFHIIQLEIIDNYEIMVYVIEQIPFLIYRKKNEKIEQLLKQ